MRKSTLKCLNKSTVYWNINIPLLPQSGIPVTTANNVLRTMTHFIEKTFTAQDGLTLYYRDYGKASSPNTPILCLPGLTRNSMDFHRVARRLSSKRRVICPDYRGRGQSDYDPNPYNYVASTYLNDLHHLLTLCGIHHFIIIGTSLGGLIAMAMALVMPSAIKGVVLNDIGPEIANNGRKRILEYIGTDSSPLNWGAAVDELQSLFPNLSLKTDEEWLEAAQATYRLDEKGVLHPSWDINLVKPLLRPNAIPDLWPIFHALNHVPVLGIRGALSDLLLPETFKQMEITHPEFTSVTIPNSGHVPSLWEPESESALDIFLNNL
ncbi:MAG: alpha/beta hydrolase [Rhodospirillaceae bacterium]|nr:alpha/beta hydrolase [Rhodospirillaceae bacterium]|tara:strand:+ start:1882 stop:2847 length:966 start_codon:yes stop_codon:yes gene_type:complete